MANQGGSEVTDYCSMGRGGYTEDKDGCKIRFDSQEFVSQKLSEIAWISFTHKEITPKSERGAPWCFLPGSYAKFNLYMNCRIKANTRMRENINIHQSWLTAA